MEKLETDTFYCIWFLGASSAVKLVDKSTLLREREAKKKVELEKLVEKEKKKTDLAAAQAAKDAQKKIPPSEMFKSETKKYSQFDDKVDEVLKILSIVLEIHSICS